MNDLFYAAPCTDVNFTPEQSKLVIGKANRMWNLSKISISYHFKAVFQVALYYKILYLQRGKRHVLWCSAFSPLCEQEIIYLNE